MEYVSTDDMLPDTLPGHHAVPGGPGPRGILQGRQMLCSTLPGKTLLKSCLKDRHPLDPCKDAADYKTCLTVKQIL